MNRYLFDWDPIFSIVLEYLDPSDYLVDRDRTKSVVDFMPHPYDIDALEAAHPSDTIENMQPGMRFLANAAHNRMLRESAIFRKIAAGHVVDVQTGISDVADLRAYVEVVKMCIDDPALDSSNPDERINEAYFVFPDFPVDVSAAGYDPVLQTAMFLTMASMSYMYARDGMSMYRISDPPFMIKPAGDFAINELIDIRRILTTVSMSFIEILISIDGGRRSALWLVSGNKIMHLCNTDEGNKSNFNGCKVAQAMEPLLHQLDRYIGYLDGADPDESDVADG
jgi:hypothetical protein